MSANVNHSLEAKIDVILERMDYQDKQMADIKLDVARVTQLVIEPENGIYGRVKSLEVSKRNNSKVFWIVFSVMASLVASSAIWGKIFFK